MLQCVRTMSAALKSGKKDISEAEDNDVDEVQLTENDVSGKVTIVVGDPLSVHVLLYSF